MKILNFLNGLFESKATAKVESVNILTSKDNTNDRKDIDNTLIAEYILKIMTELGTIPGNSLDHQQAYNSAKRIINASARKHGGQTDVQEVSLRAIKLIGKANSPRKRRILASAYSLCHTEYTLYAIKAYEDYIRGGLEVPNVENIYKPKMTKEMLKKEYIAGVYAQLGSLYEKNYEFEKALECYKKELEYDSWSHFPYLNMSEVFRKMNKPNESISILEKAKQHPNYNSEENYELFYGDVVDNFLKEAKERKAKNYVFRKRKHKDFLPL